MPFSRNSGMPVQSDTGDIVSKAARTVTGESAWTDVGDIREAILQLHSDAGSGTSPALDVKLRTSYDGTDATAVDVTTGAFTQVLAVASAQIKRLTDVHRYVKVVWTITGTTPSFNFGVYLTTKR